MSKLPISRIRLVDLSLAVGLPLVLCVVYVVEAISPHPVGEPGKKGNLISGGSLYAARTAPDRAKILLEFGGTRETEGAVLAGLDWLARHQASDGSWSNACLGGKPSHPHSACAGGTPCSVPGSNHITAQTGLALLALQAAGNYDFNDSPYSSNTRSGLKWLAENQWPDGALVGSRPVDAKRGNLAHTFMYEHAIATFALAEACAIRLASNQEEDAKLREAAANALYYIESLQHEDGGWRYSPSPREASDASVSGWVMLALKSGIEAGFPVKPETVNRVVGFFASCEQPNGRTGYTAQSPNGSDAMAAVGMLVHLFLLKDRNAAVVTKAATILAGESARYGERIRDRRPEFYTLYNSTLALYQTGGESWNRWNNAVRDPVVEIQNRGTGCNRGSWDPESTFGGPIGGRIYSTALATLMLEVYYRYSRNETGK